jgi:GNAT superfamily N-acetyltransferase
MRILIKRVGDWEDLDEAIRMDQVLLSGAPKPSEDTEFWIAYEGATVVGYAGMRCPPQWPGVAFLSRAGVAETHRGRGLQKRLIRARVARARRLGATDVVTYTSTDNAPSANSLIACGFKIYDPEYAYVGSSFVYWRKTLKAKATL